MVSVAIHPEEIARVERLTHRHLDPHGAFWRIQAERLPSGYLWSEGRIPPGGVLTVKEISREDLDAALDWRAD